jgi:hypothetical protein
MEQQPNAKCSCGSGKKYKKCCMYKPAEVAPSPEDKVPETPEEIAAFEAEFAALLGRFIQYNKDPEFVEFMHEERDAADWHIDGEQGLVIVPYPAPIQAMRAKERAQREKAEAEAKAPAA